MSDLTSVTNYLLTANEGFTTTISSDIASGAAIVPLSSVSGLTNATVFVGIIDPGSSTKQQVFTGTVDTANTRIINCVYTRGTSVDGHTNGAQVVDYVTGTAINMLSTALRQQHNQNGTHGVVTATSLSATNGLAITGGSVTLPNAAIKPNMLGLSPGSGFVATSETTASSSYVDLATTTDSATATIGTNGLALVIFSTVNYNNVLGAFNFASFAMSGANTAAANDNYVAVNKNATANQEITVGNAVLVTGLAAGSTTFKLKYKTNGTGTGTFYTRRIQVIPL